MPITTFIERHEQETLSNKDVTEALLLLNRMTGNKWLIQERIQKRFLREPIFHYSLYCRLEGGIEYQVINFYRECSSLNTMVSAEMMVAYIYGFLGGHDKVNY